MAGKKRKRPSDPLPWRPSSPEKLWPKFPRPVKRGLVSHSIVDYERSLPCTASDGTRCQLLDNLTVWNEFLCATDTELKEVAPGKLALVPLKADIWPCTTVHQRRYVCCLVYWLLREHPCIETVELRETLVPDSPSFFCDALRLSGGLRQLRLQDYYFNEETSKMVVKAVCSLSTLETLQLKSMRLHMTSLSVLRDAITRTTSLTVLSLTDIVMIPDGACKLIQCLWDNTSLRALHVDDNLLRPGRGWALAAFLRDNKNIREFSIKQTLDDNRLGLGAVMEALSNNTVLEKVQYFHFELSPSDVLILSEALEVNVTLRFLRVAQRVGSGPNCVLPSEFAKVITVSKSLVELVLEGYQMKRDSVVSFVDALKSNATLEKLEIPNCGLEVAGAAILVEALGSSGCSLTKLNLGVLVATDIVETYTLLPVFSGCRKLEWTLLSWQVSVLVHALKADSRLSSVTVHSSHEVDSAILQDMFLELRRCSSLTQLTVSLFQCIDDETATSIAQFVATTKTLKHLSLDFAAEPPSVVILVRSIWDNKSISTLNVKRWAFERLSSVYLELALKKNRSLNHLSFDLQTTCSNYYLVSALARGIFTNYTLTSLKTMEERRLERETFWIKDYLRRNVSLLHEATQFLQGSEQKRHAAAFEKVIASEALVNKVMQFEGADRTEAVSRVRRRRLYRRTHFLEIAGVVKHKLECVTSDTGEMTLDRLGLDILEKIASYLSVTDVLTEG